MGMDLITTAPISIVTRIFDKETNTELMLKTVAVIFLTWNLFIIYPEKVEKYADRIIILIIHTDIARIGMRTNPNKTKNKDEKTRLIAGSLADSNIPDHFQIDPPARRDKLMPAWISPNTPILLIPKLLTVGQRPNSTTPSDKP